MNNKSLRALRAAWKTVSKRGGWFVLAPNGFPTVKGREPVLVLRKDKPATREHLKKLDPSARVDKVFIGAVTVGRRGMAFDFTDKSTATDPMLLREAVRQVATSEAEKGRPSSTAPVHCNHRSPAASCTRRRQGESTASATSSSRSTGPSTAAQVSAAASSSNRPPGCPREALRTVTSPEASAMASSSGAKPGRSGAQPPARDRRWTRSTNCRHAPIEGQVRCSRMNWLMIGSGRACSR